MSKIGKQPVEIPAGVEVKLDGNLVWVKGPKGEMKLQIDRVIKIKIDSGKIILEPSHTTKNSSALWGLSRVLVKNMVEGVSRGFEKKLELEGIGYRVALAGKNLNFSLGYSHPVEFVARPGIDFKVEKNTITIMGIDKGLVGQVAADIRKLRPPEPYKGKGIRYAGEVIARKAGKKAVKGGF